MEYTVVLIVLIVVAVLEATLLAIMGKKRKGYIFAVVGAVIGFIIHSLYSQDIQQAVVYGMCGVVVGQSIFLFSILLKNESEKKASSFYDDGSPRKFYITGDKHRNFDCVERFCRNRNTRRKDILIVLGDAGLNYYGDRRDEKLKQKIANINITLFCIHGNKENRPQNVASYGVRSFCGGRVYYEPQYPNIFFAIDGEVYNFDGREYMSIGGAHSVDKRYCIENGLQYWYDEMPSEETKEKVEEKLKEKKNKVYGFLTHTCPLQYLPIEMLLSTQRRNEKKSKNLFKPDIDHTTEAWLSKIESKTDYKRWFCGHYHIDKKIDKVVMLYHDIRPLYTED